MGRDEYPGFFLIIFKSFLQNQPKQFKNQRFF